MKRALLLTSALLALSACETMQGLQNDMNALAAKTEAAFHSDKNEAGDKAVFSVANATASDCPAISIMPELKKLVEFTDPAKPGASTKISEFDLMAADTQCKKSGGIVNMQIDLMFAGTLGPKAKTKPTDKPHFAYPYFVAVTDENGAVVAKEIFAASVSYAADQLEAKQIETINQQLPVKSESDLKRYRVLVGFQLDEDQLAYNRKTL